MKDDQKNKVTVEIYGQRYTLVGKVSSSYIQEVAGYVDQKMNELADHNPSLDVTKTAVLTAVNLADEYFALQKEYDELLKLLDDQTKKDKS